MPPTTYLAYAISITLDANEPLDNFTMPYQKLMHLSKYVLVKVPNAKMGRLFPNLPPQVIPMTLTKHYTQLWLNNNCYQMPNEKYILMQAVESNLDHRAHVCAIDLAKAMHI